MVGEADGEGVNTRVLLGELDSDFFGIVPIKCGGHQLSSIMKACYGKLFTPSVAQDFPLNERN
jgi:hypothetical protein